MWALDCLQAPATIWHQPLRIGNVRGKPEWQVWVVDPNDLCIFSSTRIDLGITWTLAAGFLALGLQLAPRYERTKSVG